MSLVRALVLGVLVLLAVTLQVSVLPGVAVRGVVPDVALLVVVGVALVRGPEHAAAVGFGAGLLLDLVPPADHTAGRWALALVVAGYLAGLVRGDAASSAFAAVATVAASSFVATSVFAISGLVVGDPGVTVARVLEVLPVAVAYDVALTPLVVPLVMALTRRLRPAPEAAWGRA